VELTADMERVVSEQKLCFAATVCADGSPNLSPKGTVAVWGPEELAFLDLASPQTIENLRRDPRIELNVVDQRLRKGYRFKGSAEVVTGHEELEAAFERFDARGVQARGRARALVVLHVEEARPLISPIYATASGEAEVAEHWERYWRELWARGAD
jgi:predicted pyridoxine 5'-phosphate oxidase superfamily flavin-nucleotide-binding protein